jgi:hypothetical protein
VNATPARISRVLLAQMRPAAPLSLRDIYALVAECIALDDDDRAVERSQAHCKRNQSLHQSPGDNSRDVSGR